MRKLRSLIWITIFLVANSASAQLILERTLLLNDYPSGSSIEFADNKFYLIGDDATHLMILNSNYNKVDSIRLFKGNGRVIKDRKIDLESSTIVSNDGNRSLLLLGSSSTQRRKQITSYPLYRTKSFSSYSIKRFTKRLMNAGLNELNFEGLAATSDKIIIANRGHLNNQTNQLIVTDAYFWKDQKHAAINIINIDLLKQSKTFAGISGLTYVLSKDLLLFTASTENTTSSYSDGEIGDSYMGWISNFSSKLLSKEIAPDGMINLAENNQSFKKQKIESVAVQEVQNNSLILHFVADNDNGQSTLFRVRFTQ